MKIDTYKNKERYLKWKQDAEQSGIKGLLKENSDLILRYIFDMENGLNVHSKSIKGSRSYIRLNTLRVRLAFILKGLEADFSIKRLQDLTEEHLFKFFSSMRNGSIKRKDGKQYQSVGDYVKSFKALWHWHQKVNKKNGNEISDITTDLDASFEKPKWVYLNEGRIKNLSDNAKWDYRVLIWFLLDSGIRSPSELLNILVNDLLNDCKELNVRGEISKTFGRRIKLMLCSEMLKSYIKEKGLKPEDYLFQINPLVVNKYLQRLAKRLFGDEVSEAGEVYSKLSMYDFRHNSCCYWLPKYKSESALKYRFGWKKSDKIHYYSEMLGMKDTISEEDLLVDTTKTELEQRMGQTEKENTILIDKMAYMEKKMEEIGKLTEVLYEQIANRVIKKDI